MSLGKWRGVPGKHGKGGLRRREQGWEGRRIRGNDQSPESVSSSSLFPSVSPSNWPALPPSPFAGRSLPLRLSLSEPTNSAALFLSLLVHIPMGVKITLKCSKDFLCYYFLGNWKSNNNKKMAERYKMKIILKKKTQKTYIPLLRYNGYLEDNSSKLIMYGLLERWGHRRWYTVKPFSSHGQAAHPLPGPTVPWTWLW